METKKQLFYGKSLLISYTSEDILAGNVIKINPALITILDKLYKLNKSLDINQIQEKVLGEVDVILKQGNIHTLHVDINYDDYSNFGVNSPAINSHIFNIDFIEKLNKLAESYLAFLNIHLLTDYPELHIQDIKHIRIGAICFQLEVVKSSETLREIIDKIVAIGACASPVIEIIGTEKFTPRTKEDALDFLSPFQDKIGMLTFQCEATGTRSNSALGMLNSNEIIDYINFFADNFDATIQIQGGITTTTISAAINLKSEFLVCGTEIFNNKLGYSSTEVIKSMLKQADKVLLKV